MLTGCATDHDPIVSEGKPIYELRQEMKELAKSVSAELKSQHPANTRDGNRSETCNCSYEILSGSGETSEGYPELGIDFYTDEKDPLYPCSYYFSGLYYSDLNCASGGSCGMEGRDVWPSLPPPYSYSFNTDPSPNDQIQVLLNSLKYKSNCSSGDYTHSSITFRIVCVETCNGMSYPVYSPPVTLSFNPYVDPYGSIHFPKDDEWYTFIQLGGCNGCRPMLAE